MKHLTLSLLCAGLVALAACNKEKTIEPTQQPATETKTISGSVKKEKKPKVPKGWSIRTMHIIGDNKGWCDNRASNCVAVAEMTITISARAIKTELDDVADQNSAGAVAAAFNSTGWEEFTDNYIPAECLTKLQSGSYFLKRVNDDGSRASYIAGTAWPLTLESMEFGIQLDRY
jgi:hypothetical protein